MNINKTNYRAIAAYLAGNWHLVQKASSFNQLTATVNKYIKDDKIPGCHDQIKLQLGTLNTIVYALQGAMDYTQDEAPEVTGYRLTLNDPFGNEAYLTITKGTVHFKSSSCAYALSNLQYKGDVHFELIELFHQRDYAGIDKLINIGTVYRVMDTKRLTH